MRAHELIDIAKRGSKPDAKEDLKSLALPGVEKKLGSSPEGLSQAEAQQRLTQYGPNEIDEKKTNELLKFLSCFWGPIPWFYRRSPGIGRISASSSFCSWPMPWLDSGRNTRPATPSLH
jgi:magnesium-transporting ATPase (P-type)